MSPRTSRRRAWARRAGRIVHLADVRDRIMAYFGPSCVISLGAGFWAAVHVSDAPLLIDRGVAAAMMLMVLAASAAWHRQTRRAWRRMGLGGRILRTLLAWAPGLAGASALVALVTS